MNEAYPGQRQYELGDLRSKVLSLAAQYMSDIFENRDGTVSQYMAEFDEAVKALAAKLNEPEKCYACGGEMSSE